MTAYVIAVSPYNPLHDEFDIRVFFRQTWNDPRLAFELAENEANESISLSSGFNTDTLWKPDTFFTTERNGKMGSNSYVRIGKNGDVLYSAE